MKESKITKSDTELVQEYQIPCKSKQDAAKKLRLIIDNNGKLVGNKRNADGIGTITIRIESSILKKELRQKLDLFRVKITDISDQKLTELKEKFPTATIENDQEKSILITANINLKKDLELIIDSWKKTNPE